MAQVKRIRRAVHGVLILDKPRGFSSNAALQKVRWLLNAEKAGHTGSLDPLATGVLPLCFGEATKFSQYLLDADKAYEKHARRAALNQPCTFRAVWCSSVVKTRGPCCGYSRPPFDISERETSWLALPTTAMTSKLNYPTKACRPVCATKRSRHPDPRTSIST